MNGKDMPCEGWMVEKGAKVEPIAIFSVHTAHKR